MLFLFLSGFLLHFSISFARRGGPLKNVFEAIIVYAPVAVFLYPVLATDWFVGPLRQTAFGNIFLGGELDWLFDLYVLIYFGAIIAHFALARWRSRTLKERKQTGLCLNGMIFATTFGLFFDMLLPFFGIALVSMVPSAMIILVLVLSYVMVRYGLMMVRPGFLAKDVFRTMPDLLLYVDNDRIVRLANPAFCNTLGYRLQEIIGAPCEKFQGENPEKHAELDRLISEKRVLKDHRTFLKKKDGALVPVALSAAQQGDPLGQVVGDLMLYRDISQEQRTIGELSRLRNELQQALAETERARDQARQSETEINKLYQELKVVDRMKTEFLAMISHELRTPLTPIKGYSSLFLEEKFGRLAPEYKKAAAIIFKEEEHLLTLIDSILDVSRLEYGRPLELKKEPVSIKAELEEVLEAMGPQFRARQVKAETDLAPDLSAVLADHNKIHRLLTNLLGNALKFSPAGATVRVVARALDSNLEVQVIDNGLGLARENLEKIFDKFYQVDSSYVRAAGGAGLGLTIAKEIVEAHGGRIWAESEGLGRGAKIIFTLALS